MGKVYIKKDSHVNYIKQEPYVGDNGIYIPIDEYTPEGCASEYRCIMTRKMFVEAYNKWIKPEYTVSFPFISCNDDADCWCE